MQPGVPMTMGQQQQHMMQQQQHQQQQQQQQQQSEESYGYGSQMVDYSYVDVPSSVSSPPPAFPYYSDVEQPLKDGFQYSSHMGMDYSAFLQPTYTA